MIPAELLQPARLSLSASVFFLVLCPSASKTFYKSQLVASGCLQQVLHHLSAGGDLKTFGVLNITETRGLVSLNDVKYENTSVTTEVIIKS